MVKPTTVLYRGDEKVIANVDDVERWIAEGYQPTPPPPKATKKK